jgi:hypothetical protein
MPTPTQGEAFAKLSHHLDEAQSIAAQLSHLYGLQGTGIQDQALARGWLLISEQIKFFKRRVITIAQGHLQ